MCEHGREAELGRSFSCSFRPAADRVVFRGDSSSTGKVWLVQLTLGCSALADTCHVTPAAHTLFVIHTNTRSKVRKLRDTNPGGEDDEKFTRVNTPSEALSDGGFFLIPSCFHVCTCCLEHSRRVLPVP